MSISESLLSIRAAWVSRASRRLARGEGVRESFSQSLDRFYELLIQSVETGDPEWLDPLLAEWVQARTSTDLEQRDHTLPALLSQLMLTGYEIAHETLSSEDALALIGAFLPVYAHAFAFAAQQETALHVEAVSRELEDAQATLERLDKSKSDFIAIAAHELKTPLTLIEGYTSMLRDQVVAGDGQAGVLLQGINNGTRRLREIVDDMIDVSMIDNNLLSLHFQPVWINRLLEVIVQEFDSPVRDRQQALEIRKFPGCDEMTFGDAERLYQAFRNVISNAIKYTPDGGRIRVDGRKLPGFIEITVSDTGIGIDPEDQNRIFKKFGRIGSVSLHSSGKTKFKGGGPGLGLAITKGILEAHGGTIWVQSAGYDEQNCPGTTFHILLPLLKTPPDDKTAKLFRSLTEKENSEVQSTSPGNRSGSPPGD